MYTAKQRLPLPAAPANAVLLVSGGLDSFALWRLLDHPRLVYVPMGHRYQETELQVMRDLYTASKEYTRHVFDVRYLFNLNRPRVYLSDQEQADGHIPLRNLFLALAGMLEADTVYLGALKGEAVLDKSARFLKDTSRLASFLLGRTVRLLAPARQWTKTQLVRHYLAAYPTGADRMLLRTTHSCHTYERRHALYKGCGRCHACFRRWVAMASNGIEERYETHPALNNTFAPANWREGWSRLRQCAWHQWPGILRMNLEAQRARRTWIQAQ